MGYEQIGMVASVTMQDMIANTIRANSDLQKAQRKNDKDEDKEAKSTTRAGATSSGGVGINAGSVGNQDLSNMGDMRGRQSDLFSSEDEEEDEDSKELERDLDFFKKSNIYKMKLGINETEEKEFSEEEEDFEEDREEERDGESEDQFEEEEDEKPAGRVIEEEDGRDEVLDEVKDSPEKDRELDGKEKNMKDLDPEHALKDRFSSDEEKEESSEEERDDIFIPQIQIKSSGLIMEEEESSDKFVSSSKKSEVTFESPSLYEVEPEEDDKEVSDEIKNSPEYMKELANRRRVKKMIVYYPTVGIAKNLVDQMHVLGEKILETCLKFGVKIVIIRKDQKVSDVLPGGETIEDLRAGYSENLKVCFVGEEWVRPEYQNLYRFNPSIYLMAIAFDHSTGEDSFASLKSPFVLNNYHACRREESGHLFIDGLSAFSPVEYFAQTLEAYLQLEDNSVANDMTLKIYEGKICTRNELYNIDRSMYQYIDYLVNS